MEDSWKCIGYYYQLLINCLLENSTILLLLDHAGVIIEVIVGSFPETSNILLVNFHLKSSKFRRSDTGAENKYVISHQ